MREILAEKYFDSVPSSNQVATLIERLHVTSNSNSMIGFKDGLIGEERQADEGADTINLQKNELYDMVGAQYFIPPYSSKGVTRDYLLKVHRNQVFRATKQEIRHFEVDLTPKQQRRHSTINNAILIRKLNTLLQATNRRPLGFDELEVPDQGWLFRIARFIDPCSLTEFFEAPVRAEPPLSASSTALSKIHHGRMAAAEWMFSSPAMKQNKKLWESLKLISETYRNMVNHRVNVEILENEYQLTREKHAMLQGNLEDLVGKAALTFSACINSSIRPDMVLSGAEGLTPQLREFLMRNAMM